MSDGTNPLGAEADTKSMQEMREAFEKQGKELAEERKRNAEFQRAEAFRSAGIPDGDECSVQALFRESFKGELNAESIQEAWNKLGIPEPNPEPQSQAQQAAPLQGEPQTQPEPQPEIDPNVAAALADGQQIRSEFSPGLSDQASDVLKAMQEATAPMVGEYIKAAGPTADGIIKGFLADVGR